MPVVPKKKKNEKERKERTILEPQRGVIFHH
jgi:hypothetical protein